MRYDQYYLVINGYSPSGRFCENGTSLTFILRRSVLRQLHAGTVLLCRWNSNHSDLGSDKLTMIFEIFSTGTSARMIAIQKWCISEFTDKLEFKNLCVAPPPTALGGRPGGSGPGGPAADGRGALFPRPPPPFGCQTLVQALARVPCSPRCPHAAPAGRGGMRGGPASAGGGSSGQRLAVCGLQGSGPPLALVAPALSFTGGGARPPGLWVSEPGSTGGGVPQHCPLPTPSRSLPGPAGRGRHLRRRLRGGWGCGSGGFRRR